MSGPDPGHGRDGNALPACCAGEGYPGIAHDLSLARRELARLVDSGEVDADAAAAIAVMAKALVLRAGGQVALTVDELERAAQATMRTNPRGWLLVIDVTSDSDAGTGEL